MLIDFFFTLRAARLKVSVKEYLTLLEALRSGVIDDTPGPTVEKFYYLARAALVKDEAQFDKFDRAFAAYFKGVEMLADFTQDVPIEWLRKQGLAKAIDPVLEQGGDKESLRRAIPMLGKLRYAARFLDEARNAEDELASD